MPRFHSIQPIAAPKKKSCQHHEYEGYVEQEKITDLPMTTTTMEDLLEMSEKSPAELLESNAETSHVLLENAKTTGAKREDVANRMVALAIDTSAATMLRFYIKHATDTTQVIVLRIDKVTMKGTLTDERSAPDFRPFVQFSVGEEQTAGTIGDKKMDGCLCTNAHLRKSVPVLLWSSLVSMM